MVDFRTRFLELINAYSGNESDMARQLGVTKQAVSAWKHGKQSPRKDMCVKIAETFHVSLEWLMGFDVPKWSAEYPAGVALRKSEPQDNRHRTSLTNEDIAAIASYIRKESGVEDAPKTSQARIISAGIDRMPEEDRNKALAVMQAVFAQYADFFKDEEVNDSEA